jgi:hypothetical protein
MGTIIVSDKRFDTILDMIPNACVLYIKEVDNPTMYDGYRPLVVQVEEKQLFH